MPVENRRYKVGLVCASSYGPRHLRPDRHDMADQLEQPSWLNEACPDWCAATHGEHDHPDDRKHVSEGMVVPAVVAALRPGPEVRRSCDLVVVMSRRVGLTETWVHIGEAEGREHRLVISQETAARLTPVLDVLPR